MMFQTTSPRLSFDPNAVWIIVYFEEFYNSPPRSFKELWWSAGLFRWPASSETKIHVTQTDLSMINDLIGKPSSFRVRISSSPHSPRAVVRGALRTLSQPIFRGWHCWKCSKIVSRATNGNVSEVETRNALRAKVYLRKWHRHGDS